MWGLLPLATTRRPWKFDWCQSADGLGGWTVAVVVLVVAAVVVLVVLAVVLVVDGGGGGGGGRVQTQPQQ